ncbi:MAG: ketoacyl-ACP synthase III [Spirochaetaceae bacterium]|jgi:3-oxoacyl-[acyl-carrier-protein] synthase-3|nr:ketoacyl-ACP synthase III [Spirochaetaceae bacterium]
MAVVLRGIGRSLPWRVVPNDEAAIRSGTDDEWIRSHTGIVSRYFAGEGETTASLGAGACREALERPLLGPPFKAVSAEEVNLVICATATPEYSNFPATACIIQAQIGAKNAAAFDVASACTGFINGLAIADSLLRRNRWRYALVCGAETLSRILDMTDRNTCVLFGDGAGAMLLENLAVGEAPQPAKDQRRGIGEIIMGADGTGSRDLYCERGGCMIMDGRAVYTFAIRVIPDIIRKLMQRENLGMENVDLFVCHQANERILLSVEKRLGIPKGKMVYNIARCGNTSSASIPLAFYALSEKGSLRAGQTIVTAGFGAGLTWGGCVIRF